MKRLKSGEYVDYAGAYKLKVVRIARAPVVNCWAVEVYWGSPPSLVHAERFRTFMQARRQAEILRQRIEDQVIGGRDAR